MGTWGTLMAQWGIVIAFGGTMAALITSFNALPDKKKGKKARDFKFCAVVLGVGAFMQLVAAVMNSFVLKGI
jgi:hypothetical protein